MDMLEATAMMSALAQPTRYRCYTLLASEGRLSAGELAERLDVSANLLSGHLSVLSAAKLITSDRKGRSIEYTADKGVLLSLVGHLVAIAAGNRSAM